MIQKKLFFVRHDAKDGSIRGQPYEAELKSEKGTVVRCYEATDLDDAVRQATEWAKEWADRHRRTVRESNGRRTKADRAAGRCTRCRVKPLVTAWFCRECQDLANAEHRAAIKRKREGLAPRERLPAEKLLTNIEQSKERQKARWGSLLYARMLKKFDRLGATGFRDWLCRQIRKAGGGAALDEYERERAKRQGDVPEAAE